MSKPTEYLIARKLVALIENAKPSLHLLRLFHGCYAYVDKNPLLSVGVIALTNKPACTAACSDLAGITGSPSAKSNAWIREVIDRGGWKSLFSQLALNENHTELTFKFAGPVGPASLRDDADKIFAMVDSDVIRTISSANEALFYTKAAMVAKADQPGFDIPHICPKASPWTDNSKKSWLRIAARVGEKLGQHYVVIPVRDPLTRKIARVRVKVVTGSSQWSPGRLFPRPPCPPIAVVHEGTFWSLKQGELKERLNWTRALEP